jgi:hypothetical protein
VEKNYAKKCLLSYRKCLAVLGLLYVSITSELWIPEQKVRIQIISSNMGGLGEVGYFSGVGGSKGRKSKIKGWGGPIFVPERDKYLLKIRLNVVL